MQRFITVGCVQLGYKVYGLGARAHHEDGGLVGEVVVVRLSTGDRDRVDARGTGSGRIGRDRGIVVEDGGVLVVDEALEVVTQGGQSFQVRLGGVVGDHS